MALMRWIFWRNKIWRNPKIMIAVLLILFAFSFMHFLDNPEEATEMDGDERNEAAKNPLYIIGGIAMVILGYIMANKGSNKGFNGQYT